jgi:hypothetical protein
MTTTAERHPNGGYIGEVANLSYEEELDFEDEINSNTLSEMYPQGYQIEQFTVTADGDVFVNVLNYETACVENVALSIVAPAGLKHRVLDAHARW